MTGRLLDLSVGLNRKQRLTVEIDGDFRGEFDQLHEAVLDIEIKKHRKKRSLSANAYFHVLVNKIAAVQGIADREVKESLVLDYGTLAKDGEGQTIGFKLFKCYLVYKQTHLMDSKEMARLIDGAVYEAKSLGIETLTPDELSRLAGYGPI